VLLNEKHEFSSGWRAAQKGGLAGCTTGRASGLHINLGCGKGRAGGLPFYAACPALFRNLPNRLFVYYHSIEDFIQSFNGRRTELHATNKYVGGQADSCLTQLLKNKCHDSS